MENKQYLLMVDDVAMAMLKTMVPGISYIPVAGMDITHQPGFKLLATPVAVVPAPVADDVDC